MTPQSSSARHGLFVPIAAAVLACALVAVAAAPGAAEPVEVGDSGPISQGVPATASSTQFGSDIERNAREANDGDAGTRWGSAQADDDPTPWLQYDLTQQCVVTGASVHWEGAYASAYTLVGWTGEAWEVLRSVTGGAPGVADLTGFADIGPVQHVALVVDQKATAWGASIFELQYLGRDCVAGDHAPPSTLPLTYVDGSSGGDDGSGNDDDDGGDNGDDGNGGDHVRGELLSLGRPVTASSYENPSTVPAGINDGSPTTRWGSAHRDGESVTIDLEGHADIDTIEILHDPAAYVRVYRIETSPNGWEWDEFAHVSNGDGSDVTLTAPAGEEPNARFVRLTAIERGTQWGNSIFELSVYGTGYAPVPEPAREGERGILLSYLKPGTASTEQDDAQCRGCTVDKMFDRDTTTRWATDPGDTWEGNPDWDGNAWVQVDLGAPAVISQVALHWDPAYATAYDVYVSDTETGPWRQVYGTSTGNGVRDVFDIADEVGRHVRIEMTERAWVWGAQYGYSLFEFRVYGSGGDPIEPPPLPEDPDFDALELVWSDEFDRAAGTPADPAKWTMDPSSTWTVTNRELQLYTSDTHNVRHDGQGHLEIEAKVDDYHGAQLYTSGRLNTSHTFHGQYGRYEARVKVPAGQGLWPAFWMMGENFLDGTPWPSNGEIDIMEILGHDLGTTHTTIHGPGYSGMGGVGGGTETGLDLSAGFHTYGVDWDSTGFTYRFDGEEIFRIDREQIEDGLGQPWVFDQPFYMILNLAVGGEWPGSPDEDTEFPATMLVDWVRVWQSPGSGAIVDDFPGNGNGNGDSGTGVGGTGGGDDNGHAAPPIRGGATGGSSGDVPAGSSGVDLPRSLLSASALADPVTAAGPEPSPEPSAAPSAEPTPELAPVETATADEPDASTGSEADGEMLASGEPPGQSRMLPWVVGGLAVVALGGVGWLWWRRPL